MLEERADVMGSILGSESILVSEAGAATKIIETKLTGRLKEGLTARSGDKGSWRRFLEWAMPWLEHKWAFGEAVLEAKIAQERAIAEKMMAEAYQAQVRVAHEMLVTIGMARQLEQNRLEHVGASISPAELENEIRAILEKLELLEWKHGAQFHFNVQGEGITVDEPTESLGRVGPESAEGTDRVPKSGGS